MRNPIVSPFFDEESYKGQDIVHYGVRIPLQKPPNEVAKKFSRNAQRIISKHWVGLFREMRQEDLAVLRSMWFDQNDSTFPNEIGEHLGIVGLVDDRVVAGAIWTKQGNNLFLHQLIAGDEGKDIQMPTRLIWESVNLFNGKYHSLDIGVSYNPKRYEFFKNFAVETYPIILKKPFYVPVIRLSPFRSFELPDGEDEYVFDSDDATFVPRGSYGIYALLKHLNISKGDVVVIVKTFGSDFISGCVTRTIERAGASWVLNGQITPQVKGVIALHEFGIPIFQDKDLELLKIAHAANVPIIEDCAWRWNKVFSFSKYAVYSFQKMFNVNYGGMVTGVKIPDEKLWQWGCLDVVKRDRWTHEAKKTLGIDQRRRNWDYYHSLVLADGMTPDDCIDYANVRANGWVPTVYLQKFETNEIADAIVDRLEQFGIQAGRYWGEPVVYLPIHQNMSIAETEYMFAVVRGYFNLCRDYRGTIKAEGEQL